MKELSARQREARLMAEFVRDHQSAVGAIVIIIERDGTACVGASLPDSLATKAPEILREVAAKAPLDIARPGAANA